MQVKQIIALFLRYADAFQNRSDITVNLQRNLTCDTLLVTGAKSNHVQNIDNVFQFCDKTRYFYSIITFFVFAAPYN